MSQQILVEHVFESQDSYCYFTVGGVYIYIYMDICSLSPPVREESYIQRGFVWGGVGCLPQSALAVQKRTRSMKSWRMDLKEFRQMEINGETILGTKRQVQNYRGLDRHGSINSKLFRMTSIHSKSEWYSGASGDGYSSPQKLRMCAVKTSGNQE